jgi:hypothetical protein
MPEMSQPNRGDPGLARLKLGDAYPYTRAPIPFENDIIEYHLGGCKKGQA